MKRNIILLSLLSLFTMPMLSQTTFGIGQMQQYLVEYITPTAEGLATTMGTSWAHSAKTSEVGAINVSIDVMSSFAPKSMLEMSSADLTELSNDNLFQFGYIAEDGSTSLTPPSQQVDLPTMASAEDAELYFRYKLDAFGNSSVWAPAMEGRDARNSTNFVLQASVGLPKNTELLVRLLPAAGGLANNKSRGTEVDKMNTYGVGVKHDLTQWVTPTIDGVSTSFVNVTALLAYSVFNYEMTSTAFSMRPQDFVLMDNQNNVIGVTDANPSSAYDGQGYDLQMKSLVGSILIGLDIPEFQPFVGVGFNKASISTGLTGEYPLLQQDASDPSGKTVSVIGLETSPVRHDSDVTLLNLQAGFNMMLDKFGISMQYSYQGYSVLSGGVTYSIQYQ